MFWWVGVLIWTEKKSGLIIQSFHLDHIAKGINSYSKNYEKKLLMGDFNVSLTEANMAAFCNEYKLKASNKESTCFKNYMSPSCIDLYLTNCPKGFESTS